jgi:hypothetical protein
MSASETPFVAVADVMNPARSEWAAKSQRAEHRAIDKRSGFEPIADVGRGAQPAVGDERDGDLAPLAFLVGFAPAQRHDKAARIIPQIRNVERGGFGATHGAGERQQQPRAVAAWQCCQH